MCLKKIIDLFLMCSVFLGDVTQEISDDTTVEGEVAVKVEKTENRY